MTEHPIEALIGADIVSLVAFLSEPMHLSEWTVHRNLYFFDNSCWEATSHKGKTVFTEIKVSVNWLEGRNRAELGFKWIRNAACIKQFMFNLTRVDACQTVITTSMNPDFSSDKIMAMHKMLSIEFTLLNTRLNPLSASLDMKEAEFMHSYHLGLSS